MSIYNKTLLAALILLTGFSFELWAQGSKHLIQDSQRQQGLKNSAGVWFEQNVLPTLRTQVHSINGYGVFVREPKVVLPPNLGGPKNQVHVEVEIHFSGWIERSYSYYDRYNNRFHGLPDYGAVNCRFQQKLWADIDPKTGKPLRVKRNQRAVLMFACASPGVPWPPRTP